MAPKNKKIVFLFVYWAIAITLFYLSSKKVYEILFYLTEVNENVIFGGFLLLIIFLLAVLAKANQGFKNYIIIFVGVLTLAATYFHENTAFRSVINICNDFEGSIFILFNQSDAESPSIRDNIAFLNISQARTSKVVATSADFDKFFSRMTYIIAGGSAKNIIFLEEVNPRRVFNFRLYSLIFDDKKSPLYFCSFNVAPNKMTDESYKDSQVEKNHALFLDSAKILLKTSWEVAY